jgi:cobalt-zinc-cadmium efflux system membrane fusion protein
MPAPMSFSMTPQRTALLLVMAALAPACGGSPPHAPKPAAAATVQNPKPESELATITLTAESEKHLALKTAAVEMGSVAASRLLGGEAVVAPGGSVIITAPMAGTLAGRAPAVGPIAKGATVFELIPLQAGDRDALAAAERESQEAEARAIEVDQRVRRLEGLLKEGSASQRAVDEAKTERTIAQAAATAAGRKLAALRRVPMGADGELAITSPIAGTITALRAAPGQSVSAGAPLADIAAVDALWVRVAVYAGEAASVDRNRNASVTVLGHETIGPWRDARPVTGPPSADAASASVDLYYALAGLASIRPGERLSVRVPLVSAAPVRALMIPASAVVYDLGGGAWVYEQKAPHVFVRRRVEISASSGGNLIVARGLREGLQIVTVGVAELYGTEFYVSK